MTPAPRVGNGTSTTLTATLRKLTVDITSMLSTVSMSMRESSCLTGLFSYYNFDNWAYQPSYVSSNTPWFFNGVRVQIFPTEKLKIEPWLINGWQSYGRFNGRLGFGGQVLYRPTGWLSVLSNDYGAVADAFGLLNRTRY